MDIKTLRKKSHSDLQKELTKQREALAKLVREKRTSEKQDIHAMRLIRKDIARIMTAINEPKEKTDE